MIEKEIYIRGNNKQIKKMIKVKNKIRKKYLKAKNKEKKQMLEDSLLQLIEAINTSVEREMKR